MKVYILNDTSRGHCGSRACMFGVRKRLEASGYQILGTHKAGDKFYSKHLFEAADFIICNGEGTMHHNAEMALLMIEWLGRAKSEGKRTGLVNTVFQEMDKANKAALSGLDIFITRDALSLQYAKEFNPRVELLPDMCVSSVFNIRKWDYNFDPDARVLLKPGEILVGDTHPHSLNHEILDGLDYRVYAVSDERYFRDLINSLRQARLYITGQHHGVYAAILAGIPFIAVPSNSWKIEGLFEMLDIKRKYLCRSLAEIRSRINEAINDAEYFTKIRYNII